MSTSESDLELSSCEWSDIDTDNSNTSCSWTDQETCQLPANNGTLDSSALNTSFSSDASWTPPLLMAAQHSTPKRQSISSTKLRCSPRMPKINRKYFDCEITRTPNSNFTTEKWSLFNVMEMNGCEESCVASVHGLTEYDVLCANNTFSSMNIADQRRWIYEYFSNHCPNNDAGISDPSGLQFILCGKNVCQAVWLATLAISTSRFYDIRKQFIEGEGPPERKKSRSLSAKSVATISWMTSYFNK